MKNFRSNRDIFLEELTSFADKIEFYSKSHGENDRMENVLSKGLKVFSKNYVVSAVSVFLMNNDSFEFEFKFAYPETSREENEKKYENLVENGVIGIVLQSASYSFYEFDEVNHSNFGFMIIPLISGTKVLGILILDLVKSPSEIEQINFKLINILASLFAAAVDIHSLNEREGLMKNMFEQNIAVRTMNLVKSKKKLQDKFQTLQANLTMSLPHEFRTPIMHVMGNTDFLIKHLDSTKQDDLIEILQDIHSATKRLHTMVEHFLLLERIEMIALNQAELIDLKNKSIESTKTVFLYIVSSRLEDSARLKDLSYTFEDIPLKIAEEYITIIIEELLDNCLKYSDEGTPITITGCKNGEFFEIVFHDHGRGMTREQIEFVDPYIQFDRQVFEQQGMGLGMAIVRRIIDIYDGEMKIDSIPDEFTKVAVKIPLN